MTYDNLVTDKRLAETKGVAEQSNATDIVTPLTHPPAALEFLPTKLISLMQHHESHPELSASHFFDSLKPMHFPTEQLRNLLEIPIQTPYHRLVLYRSPLFEIVLARWQTAKPCAAHDHGGGWGWVKVLEGSILNFECRPFSSQPCSEFVLRQQTIESHDWLISHPRSIHYMAAESSFPSALTLHFYRGANSPMRIFDYTQGISVLVTEDSGAWFPGGMPFSTVPKELNQ